MNKPFEVELSRPGKMGFATLTLPAAPWELLDALDRVRVANERDIYIVEMFSCKLPGLMDMIPVSANLYEMNHLAQRLSELDNNQLDCFEGMVKMDREKGATSIPAERLINFTHSMDDCHFIFRVYTDAALGKFYVDNGFPVIPENLPEILYEILDYESIGRKARMAEGGVFTTKGYVVQSGEIAQTYREGGAVPKQAPGYTILLEVRKGFFNDPAYDNELSEFLMLPNDDSGLDRAVRQVDAAGAEECGFAVADCAVPELSELIGDALHDTGGGCYGAVNELAGQLQRLSESGRLTTYKAMLEAAPQDLTLEEAIDLAGQSADFILARDDAGPDDYARTALERCEIPLREELLRGANLHRYGEKLMEQDIVVSTDYGLLRSLDGMTVEQCLDRPRQTMEMK